MAMAALRPFRCGVAASAIEDLHARIDRTRWPDQLDDVGWSFGTDKSYLGELVQYWRHSFDWRHAEAELNGVDQFLLDIDGLPTHFLHRRSPHLNATPLILCHGWPGSIIEFLDVIPRLTEPEKFGGRAEDAFHVVCPSLPGFGFSPAPVSMDMHIGVIARRHAHLMATLGYARYFAQGGDLGSAIARLMPVVDPEHCAAIHLNLINLPPPADVAEPMALATPAERARLQRAEQHQRDGGGYQLLQSTRPQTLAYALQDSPVGLCAWIAEKFHSWSDCDGEIRNAISWDRLLANISLYWYTASIASSVRLYRQNALAFAAGKVRFEPIGVPTGVAVYPQEIYHSARAWVERALPLVHWSEAEKGGHFAALEQPQYFAADLWRFKQAVADTTH